MKIFIGTLLTVGLLLMSCDNTDKPKPQEENAKPSLNIEKATTELKQLKEQVAAGKKAHKFKQKLREEIGMKSFNEAEVEVSQAEIFYDSSATVHVEVIYFKVVPVGLKRWYFNNGKPVAVEVFDYIQAEDATLEENPLYKVLLSADENIYEFPNPAIEVKEEKQTALVNELIKEQKILKALADKYRPKSE